MGRLQRAGMVPGVSLDGPSMVRPYQGWSLVTIQGGQWLSFVMVEVIEW